MHSSPTSASISPETVSQAGAGALLATVALVELWLAFWAAGWWHRCGGFLVAAVGVALLARAIAAVVPLRRKEPVRRPPRPEPASARRAPARLVVAEWAHR